MAKAKNKQFIQTEQEAFALVGRRGGSATYKKHGASHMSDIGKIGAQKRWENYKKSKNK